MAIEKTYLLGKNITLGCGFDLQAKAPLDSRQVVPEYDGLQALIDGNAAYEGMIVYDEGTKKTYQAQLVDGALAFREFGINEAELKELIASETTAAMEFKGAATALPENPSKGDFYKVTAEIEVTEGETAKIGDSIVYDGTQWFVIPSGDDIEDTWRPVTDVNNDASLTFAAGDKLDVAVAANGTITYSHEAIDAPVATPVGEDEQTRTYITAVETDGHGHITGYKTATENVEDTNTTYEFEGLPVGEDEGAPSSVYFQVKSSEEEAAEVIYLDAYNKNEADGKFVAKETGKSLVDDDEIAKLAGVSEGANKVEASTNGKIKIDGVDTDVYVHPDSHTASEISDFATEVAKVKVDEAVKAAQDGNGKVIADTYETVDSALNKYNDLTIYTDNAIGNLEDRLDGTLDPLVVARAKADKDGNEITATYETKTDAGEKLNEAKRFVTESIQAFCGDLINGEDFEGNKLTVAYADEANSATKATQDGNGKVIADTYAEKATTLAGYGIGDAYTKTEIETLLTWGSF